MNNWGKEIETNLNEKLIYNWFINEYLDDNDKPLSTQFHKKINYYHDLIYSPDFIVNDLYYVECKTKYEGKNKTYNNLRYKLFYWEYIKPRNKIFLKIIRHKNKYKIVDYNKKYEDK